MTDEIVFLSKSQWVTSKGNVCCYYDTKLHLPDCGIFSRLSTNASLCEIGIFILIYDVALNVADAYSNTHQSESLRFTFNITQPSAPSACPGNAWTEARVTAFCNGHFFLDPHILAKSHNEFRVSSGHAEDRWKKWQKARAGVTARTRGGGRVSRAKLIGWARRSVTTSCGSPLSGCCLKSLMEPINKDRVCARNRVQPEEVAKQAAVGRVKPAVISKLSVI